MEKCNILFTHYGIGSRDGVNAIIFRNITGFQALHPECTISLAGKLSDNISEFESSYNQKFSTIDIPEFSPGHWDKSVADCTAQDYIEMGDAIFGIMKEKFAPFNIIIAENLQVGNFPPVTYAYYKYAQWCSEYDTEKRFVFRAHDFFSDRPENFINVRKLNNSINPELPDWHTVFFPDLPNVYFAAINIKSMNFVYDHGIPEDRLFFLPNCLDETIRSGDDKSHEFRDVLKKEWELDDDEKIIFSPIRCTPRKNIEESILLLKVLNRLSESGVWAPEKLRHNAKFHLILSMNVDSGKAATYSKAVEKYIEKNDLPAHIGFKGLIDLERRYNDDGSIATYALSDAYSISSAVLTTSVLEGFGFVFLEPWCTDNFLIGRNLDDVTYDFKAEANVSFEGLYEELTVDGTDFPNIGSDQSYINKGGNILNKEQIEKKLNIVDMISDDDFFTSFLKENQDSLYKIVSAQTDTHTHKDLIPENKKKIESHYTREASARTLEKIINSVVHS